MTMQQYRYLTARCDVAYALFILSTCSLTLYLCKMAYFLVPSRAEQSDYTKPVLLDYNSLSFPEYGVSLYQGL